MTRQTITTSIFDFDDIDDDHDFEDDAADSPKNKPQTATPYTVKKAKTKVYSLNGKS